MDLNKRFFPFESIMEREGLPEILIRTFEFHYCQLIMGGAGLIPENTIVPIDSLPEVVGLPDTLMETGNKALKKTVMIKLNGGLGTSMGLDKPKSLLKCRQNRSFIDIIANQAIMSSVPLVLMNSFATRDETLSELMKYKELKKNIPLDFLQHKVPKVSQSDFMPVVWPQNRELEWCPPGHGDIYTAMITSGILDLLLKEGYMYAFISNADNLGAVIDKTILGYFVKNKLTYLMEAASRTEEDKKGGHLALLNDNHPILREFAQCPSEDMVCFQDIKRHKYFNTNNIWINLQYLKELMESKNNILDLPLICNAKTVDPSDTSSIPVYQLETAMGAAISVFENAKAIRVPRSRFFPVKTTNDLLAINSDLYMLTDDFCMKISNERKVYEPLIVELDERYYRFISQLEMRFPHGSPSMVECTRFKVKGDVMFGKNIRLIGSVKVSNKTDRQILIQDNSVLEGEIIYK